MESNPIPPIAPENSEKLDRGEARRVSGQAYTVEVFADDPEEPNRPARPLGRVRIQPGPVKPGHIAAVRTPDGCLTLRRIYYERAEGQQEFVRLEGFTAGARTERYPLGDVSIEGTVICVCVGDEECPCDEELMPGAGQPPITMAKPSRERFSHE